MGNPVIPLTAIMTIKLDCPERLANAMTVTHYLLDLLGIQQVLMVETDSSPKLLGTIVHPRLRWLYVQTPAEDKQFHRAHATNTALPWVETPVVALWDVDGLVHPEAVVEGVRLASTTADMVIPFEQVLYLRQGVRLNEQLAKRDWPGNRMALAESLSTSNPGLVTIFNTSYFRHIRGLDERFRAYGAEDLEIAHRVYALGGRIIRLTGDGLHLWHPSASRAGDPSQNSLKQAIIDELASASAEQVRAMLGVSPTIGSYVSRVTQRPSGTSASPRPSG